MKPLYIYNLFPKLYKNIKVWEKEVPKIADMGFNTIYINPLHYPGFSGSIYAPKDYYQYNPQFFSPEEKEDVQIEKFIKICTEYNIDVVIDLVVNHTSIDSVLIEKHKNWYILNDGEIKNPGAWENGNYIEWGDLAELNIEKSPDKENLWQYLLDLCRYLLNLGFKGFRCDAAYQVPDDFWKFLISTIKTEFKGTLFLAETLGCTPVQIQTLKNCDFDYIFNSSKWWNYNDSWCLEQYSMTRGIAPSISFPESHDTERLYNELNGNKIQFLERVYFEAIFSKGFMITSGLEYGFKKRINTVSTTHQDWEDTKLDFTKNIKNILTTKNNLIPLHEESPIEIINNSNWMHVFCFVKEWDKQRVLVILNKDHENPQPIELLNIEYIIRDKKIKDYSPEEKIKGYIKDINIILKPGELKILACENHYQNK